MPARYTRDQIISIAIQQARLANWEANDMPDGVVLPNAFAIQWLQDIVDFWHHHVPFSATVSMSSFTITAQQSSITMASDFILDVRNGLYTQGIVNDTLSYVKRYRLPLQKFLNRKYASQRATNVTTPLWYCIAGDDGVITTQYQTMLITPTPTQAVQAQLWQYKLPPPLEAGHKPKLPSDFAGIEYVKLRGLEKYHIIPPGTAKTFADTLIATAKVNGLLNEPEDDEIPFDEQVYIRASGYQGYMWMGPQ